MKRLFIASLMFVLICIGSYSVAAEDYSYVLPKGYKNYEATGNVMFSIAKDGTCQIMLQKIDNVGKMAKEQLALYTPESMIQVFETGFVNRKYLRSDGSYLELLSDTTAKETSIGKDNYYCIQVDAELADYGYTYSYSDFFARNYYMFSENHTYVLTFQSLNKDYFDSKESLNFLDSFEIKSEKVLCALSSIFIMTIFQFLR